MMGIIESTLARLALSRGSVSPEAFGDVDGGDVAFALQRAIATGKHVEVDPSRRYKFGSRAAMDGQALVGGSLQPIGDFNVL